MADSDEAALICNPATQPEDDFEDDEPVKAPPLAVAEVDEYFVGPILDHTPLDVESIKRDLQSTKEALASLEKCRRCLRARPDGGRVRRLRWEGFGCDCYALCVDCHAKLGRSKIIKTSTRVRMLCPAEPQHEAQHEA